MIDVTQEYVTIPGPRRLAGELAYPIDEPRAACLLIGPHPYMGGRMDNNVIAALAGALPELGCVTLRFDYTGAGASEGAPIDVAASMAEFWSSGIAPIDPLMLEDARGALRWLRERAPTPLFLVGYSFGAYVAWSIAPEDAAGVALISPTLERHAFTGRGPAAPALILRGDNDFATSDAAFETWIGGLGERAEWTTVHGGQHFFIGREAEVTRRCSDFIDATLGSRGEPR